MTSPELRRQRIIIPDPLPMPRPPGPGDGPPLDLLVRLLVHNVDGEPKTHAYLLDELNNGGLKYTYPLCEIATLHPAPHEKAYLSTRGFVTAPTCIPCVVVLDEDAKARHVGCGRCSGDLFIPSDPPAAALLFREQHRRRALTSP